MDASGAGAPVTTTTTASSATKKKLLIVLGAGSSLGLGMPSVADLDERIRGWAADWSQRHGWPNYYHEVETATRTYALSGQASPRPTPTFETVLGDMAHLSHWLTPPPLGLSLRQAVGPEGPSPFSFPHPDGYGPAHLVQDQLQHLLTQLAADIRQRSRQIDAEGMPLAAYRALLDGLRADFDLGIYNLNYDSAALAAWPEASTGFVAGDFSPERVHASDDWGFVYHLHGSVHHALADALGSRIVWRDELTGDFTDGHQGVVGDERSEGRTFPKSTLIAGGLKLDQLLVEPFHSLHAALVRHAYQADAILVGGYGFADVHVNRALRNRLEGLALSGRPPVMVLDWARHGTLAMAGRMDAWSRDLSRSLGAPNSFFRDPREGGWPEPELLARTGGFELSETHRTAIWHGGFLEAADHVDRIALWLSGANGALD